MYVTTNYLGISKGSLSYLFFLLSEDYIEKNKRISEAMRPLQEKFAKDLGGAAAIVRPTDGDATENTEKILSKKLFGRGPTEFLRSISGETPLLLVLDRGVNEFNPHHDRHVLISLRNSIDEFGNVKVFEIEALFRALSDSAHRGDLFECAEDLVSEQSNLSRRNTFLDSLQLRPNFFGIGVDLIAAFKAVSEKRLTRSSGTAQKRAAP